MLTVYSYSEKTKEYIGTTIAQIDYRASYVTNKLTHMMPANSTEIKPPVTGKNQIAVFNGNGWDIEQDYRNEVVYSLINGSPLVIKDIGPIPTGYVKELPERVTDIKSQVLFEMKAKFNTYLSNTKLNIAENSFYYSSLSRLIQERDINIAISRDDDNKFYTFSKEDYNKVIDYLAVFGQLLYIQKWKLEKDIINCNDIESLKTLRTKINFVVSEEELESVLSLTPTKRKNYIVKLSDNI